MELRIPAKAMSRSGRVKITQLSEHEYAFHIYPPWKGNVDVVLPAKRGIPFVAHLVAGRWRVEPARLVHGRAIASVHRLSIFTDLVKCIKNVSAAGVIKCLVYKAGVHFIPRAIFKHIVAVFFSYDPCEGIGIHNFSVDLLEIITSACLVGDPPPPPPPPPPPAKAVTLAQGPAAPAGYRYAIRLAHFPANVAIPVSCRDSASRAGFNTFYLSTDSSGGAFTESACYSGDGPDHWAVADGVESNHVTWAGGAPPPPPPPSTTHWEQESIHHPVNTFTNYHNASGMGTPIATAQWVEVSCKVYDPTIPSVNPDGYWYRISSSPWNDLYYSPANTFMNGDPPEGPYTHNTDFSVPNC